MIHAQSQTLHASPFAQRFPAFAAPPVDRETALALRRTTASSPVARQAKKGRRFPRALAALAQSPLICTLPADADAPKSSVPVVLVPRVPAARTVAPPAAPQAERPCTRTLRARVQLDLSWMVAIFVALFVTLALAIPLELFRQNG